MHDRLGHPPTAAYAAQRLGTLLNAARKAGIRVRREWLDGQSGGLCEFGGSRWLFVDLSLSVAEQLEQAAEALTSAGSSDSSSQGARRR